MSVRPLYKPDPAYLAGLSLTGPATGDPLVQAATLALAEAVGALATAETIAASRTRDLLRALLLAHGGNVSATARALGLGGKNPASGHVILRRWVEALGLQDVTQGLERVAPEPPKKSRGRKKPLAK